MKKRWKMIVSIVVLVVAIALLFPMILEELHKTYYWIPRPGYFNYAFVQEVEIIVGDESILVSDRDFAIGLMMNLGDNFGRIRVNNFSNNRSLGTEDMYLDFPFSWTLWSSMEEALSTGFDYRFEIILRGRGRTLTLVPVNVDVENDLKFRYIMLLAIETEQLLFPWGFDGLFFWTFHQGLPVDVSQTPMPAHWSRPSE